MQKKSSKIKSIISIIIVVLMLIVAYKIYQKNNFNNFMKAEYNLGVSKFERDEQIKYTDANSYKIHNPDYNDAMFFETVEVKPNTPYRVTCKIKTENVKSKIPNSDSGAHICISGTFEKSDNVIETSDWTEVEFYFNSKNTAKNIFYDF